MSETFLQTNTCFILSNHISAALSHPPPPMDPEGSRLLSKLPFDSIKLMIKIWFTDTPPLICSFPWQHQHLLLIGRSGSSTCSTRLQICHWAWASVSQRSSAIDSAASCVCVADCASSSSSSSWLSSLLGPGLWFPARTLMNTWKRSVRLCLILISGLI